MGTIGGLDSYFQSIINSSMQWESQKLQRLETQKTTQNTQKNLYTGLQSRFVELQKLTQSLITKDANYAIVGGRASAISPFGTTAMINASVSTSAIAGEYGVAINRLATAATARSAQQASLATPLNLAGDFYVGGRSDGPLATAGSTNAAVITGYNQVADTTVAGAIDSGKKQLGSDNYNVEVRKDGSTWQFRLVDSESGQAVSIRSGSDTTTHTTAWQNITAGTVDTGRGLKFTFADPATFSDSDQGVAGVVSYAAQGSKVSATATQTLADIAYSINTASYAEGNEILASIVDRRLILTSKRTGREMLVSENSTVNPSNNILRKLDILSGADDGIGTFNTYMDSTAAQTAQFKVNGMELSRKSNTGLTNVIAGVTLNLTGVHTDWVTQSDKINVTENMTAANKAVTDFLGKFNEMMLLIDENTGVTKIADNQYTRGGLADDTIFSELRSTFFTNFSTQHSTTYQRANKPGGGAGDVITLGAIKSLREIGIGLDDNLTPTILDQSKLDTALANQFGDVKSILDAVMGSIDDQIGRFTGVWGDYGSSTTSYINTAMTNFDAEIRQTSLDITDENARLDAKEASLTQQYAELQSQLLSLQYMQQSWSTIYGSTSRMY